MMGAIWEAGIACVGVACAGAGGYNAWRAYEACAVRSRYRKRVRAVGGPSDREVGAGVGASALDAWALAHAASVSRQIACGKERPLLARWGGGSARMEQQVAFAGLSHSVSVEGAFKARVHMLALGAAGAGVLGAVFSGELALMGACVGACVGWRLVPQAIRRQAQARAHEMERHLPEMLDVIALGMRSGLSFDRSLSLYTQHFDTMLAWALSASQRQWACGLSTREDALRQVVASYDSAIFSRVVGSVIRSLRFGSSMVENLEAAAHEARVAYRSRKQEQVAKAPVKMMVPTGALILPAMLLMVLGPVLLELAGGF